jgi:hypothetical protein
MKLLGQVGENYIHLEMAGWYGIVWICCEAYCDRFQYPTLHQAKQPRGKWQWTFYTSPHFWQDDVVKAVSKATRRALELHLTQLKHASDVEVALEVAQEVVEQLLGSTT